MKARNIRLGVCIGIMLLLVIRDVINHINTGKDVNYDTFIGLGVIALLLYTIFQRSNSNQGTTRVARGLTVVHSRPSKNAK